MVLCSRARCAFADPPWLGSSVERSVIFEANSKNTRDSLRQPHARRTVKNRQTNHPLAHESTVCRRNTFAAAGPEMRDILFAMNLQEFFLKQKEAVRSRTRQVVAMLRPEQMTWRPEKDALTIGEPFRRWSARLFPAARSSAP